MLRILNIESLLKILSFSPLILTLSPRGLSLSTSEGAMVRAFQKLWIISNYFPPLPQDGEGIKNRNYYIYRLMDNA